jgi:hypothetical protein
MIDRKDYEEYLIRLYFGNSDDLLTACINRAYRDFNRTIHGIDRLEAKDQLHQDAYGYLKKSFSDIQTGCVGIAEQEEFDRWHQSICSDLSRYYNKHGYGSFAVGQAQKWINMTFKYIFTMGSDRISGFDNLYKFCHIPLDNIILKKLRDEYEFPGLSCAWSRLGDYSEYLSCQKWIRQTFTELPLDIEFKLWINGEIPDSKKRRLQNGLNTYTKRSGREENMDKKYIGPYQRTRIILCSADAGPDSQANENGEAASFFPKAKWVGAVRNAADDLKCRFVILTTAHGMVNRRDIISPYDLKAEDNKKKVSKIWRNTVPKILGSNNYDLLLFYAGGVPRKPYMELFLPILRDLKIDFIVFGWPMMRDSGKIKVVAEMLEKGLYTDELKYPILKYPEKFTFVPWKDNHY